MSEYKCRASIDGICRNVIGCGTHCEGYSSACSLRNTYETFDDYAKRLQDSLNNAFGIKGDENDNG